MFASGFAAFLFEVVGVEEGGWISGARTAEECFMYARGEINGDGAKFETGQARVKARLFS